MKSSPESCLLSAVSEELQSLESQITPYIEEEAIALSLLGIIHQSELTYLLLKHKIPLKFSTLDCIFKSFIHITNSEQVNSQRSRRTLFKIFHSNDVILQMMLFGSLHYISIIQYRIFNHIVPNYYVLLINLKTFPSY